jgi:Leucine-rich repeat (LRR) protein
MIEIKAYLVEYTIEDYFKDNYYSLNRQNKLTSLYCCNKQLTSLEGIENCINLKELHCWNNQLTSLKGIDKCINLEYLYCNKNQLTSLNGIENLTKLKELWCDDLEDINKYKDKIKKITIFI